jgi:hypothetical protein
MALRVMEGKRRAHVSDVSAPDMTAILSLTTILGQVESVFYLLFLFFFTFGKPQTDPFLHGSVTWHHSIEEWTTGSLSKMAQAKRSFFSNPDQQLSEVLQRYTCPEWQDDGATKESIENLVAKAYAVAWRWLPEDYEDTLVPSGASAKDMIKCLEAWLKGTYFLLALLASHFVDFRHLKQPNLRGVLD